MKVLLTAINAKYIHSNLAVYSLKAYARTYSSQIEIREFTINNHFDDILQDIYREKPDFIGFSCYIWNINLIDRLCTELRKVLPEARIWLGGPEVSYDAKERLLTRPEVDGIIIGEGEATFLELMDYYLAGKRSLDQISGIAYRDKSQEELEDKVIETSPRETLDLNALPFPYENMEDFKNKIIYYETSRGCPYSCSYCLSSMDKKVRLRDIDLVKKELEVFLSYRVPQVKFVDRTFNCNRQHALTIWKYIRDHDNGVTNFHFEISADILTEEEIQLLSTMREGLVQFEIGVQSTNPATIKAIQRKMNFEKLGGIVKEIHKGRNIHVHLDLIAGLPFEDISSFQNSFNEVYALKPDQFQLGFLKVLKGSAMFYESQNWGIVYQSEPPFEVLYTKWLSYDDILLLKTVENMVEVYYNSGQFEYGIKYLEHFFETPFEMYYQLGKFYEQNHLTGVQSSRMKKYEILIDFCQGIQDGGKANIDVDALKSILSHDLYLRECLKSRPPFADEYEEYKKVYRDFYRDDKKIRECLKLETEDINIDQVKRFIHLEHYNIDIEKTAETGITVKRNAFILYDYLHRNPLNNQARTMPVQLD